MLKLTLTLFLELLKLEGNNRIPWQGISFSLHQQDVVMMPCLSDRQSHRSRHVSMWWENQDRSTRCGGLGSNWKRERDESWEPGCQFGG
jgi:hypothetical protein